MDKEHARDILVAFQGDENNWESLDKYLEVLYNRDIDNTIDAKDQVSREQYVGRVKALREVRKLFATAKEVLRQK